MKPDACDTCGGGLDFDSPIPANQITFLRCRCGQLYRGEAFGQSPILIQAWEFVKAKDRRFIEFYFDQMEANPDQMNMIGQFNQEALGNGEARITTIKGASVKREASIYSQFRQVKAKGKAK